MWDVVLTSGLAVAGTLGGSWLASRSSAKQQLASNRHQSQERWRTEVVDAVARLVAAVADHRGAMVARLQAELADGFDEGLSAKTRETRAAVTEPLVRVVVLERRLHALANQAAQASFALVSAVDEADLEALRKASVDADHDLTDATAGLLHAS